MPLRRAVCSLLLLTPLIYSSVALSAGSIQRTCTLNEKKVVDNGMMIPSGHPSKKVKVLYADGGVTFKYAGVLYASPRLDASGEATDQTTGFHYVYDKTMKTINVSNDTLYLELSPCN